MNAPGMMIVEAPMGEGKTEAALAAAEILAARFGLDGIAIAMPTQATADPMLVRVGEWARAIDPNVPVALLHGRRRFNPYWAAMVGRSPTSVGDQQTSATDEYGLEVDLDAFDVDDGTLGLRRGTGGLRDQRGGILEGAPDAATVPVALFLLHGQVDVHIVAQHQHRQGMLAEDRVPYTFVLRCVSRAPGERDPQLAGGAGARERVKRGARRAEPRLAIDQYLVLILGR